ncbi:PD-(D/E)XK motif protein [Niallia circulans]|uniref:PD-(D/E)XK motif protein n=1 Tax=Niallia circulans TaxID=1397 RepID=UPI0026F0E4B6|nr:PD-(D/E)XK motif protein [Niallia circulans]
MKKLVKTLSIMNNPWLGLEQLNRRRVKESINYNAFWIVDALNRYGLMIQCDEDFIKPIRKIKLNGIEIQLDNTATPNKLILLLKDMKDWEIFLIICNDLINVMKERDQDIIINVMKRLERWQKLLQRTTIRVMSKEEQMGLYSELKILQQYIVPKYGYHEGIRSWVGALGDKQDFLLEGSAIEVKSNRITSGNSVWISSKEQLNSEKNPLYLLVCALNEVDKGETIADVFQSIADQIRSEGLLDEFIEKVELYGYIPELSQESLSKFLLEQVNSYEVRDGFPRISLNNVSPWIKSMKYSIDLSGCSQFKVSINAILE